MTAATAVPVVNEAGGGQVWSMTHLLKIFSLFVSTGHTMWKSE